MNNIMKPKTTFLSRVFCSLEIGNSEFESGMRGAIANVVCLAFDISEAVEMISETLKSYALTVRGFDFVFDLDYADRPPSEYEKQLISKLDKFPVQFENVHYFPPDS